MKSNKYWFKPKKFGWGFVPISWEGWCLTLMLVILLSISTYTNNIKNGFDLDGKNGLRFILDVVIITIIFSFISIPKTKGKVKWRWGK